MTSKTLLRPDGSPLYLRIKQTPHGPALAIHGKYTDTMLRLGKGDYHTVYRKAVTVLMDIHGTKKREDRLALQMASTALLKRCGYKLKQRVIHEVHALEG